MHLERGQATVEHVGLVFAVALLLGGVAGALARGPAEGLARSIAGALSAAITALALQGDGAGAVTAAEQAYFAWSVDEHVPADERPTLRDVRLRLEQRLGGDAGRVAFARLVGEHAASLLPAAGAPTRYRARAGPVNDPAAWFATPVSGERPDVETPLAPLQVRPVSAAAAAGWLSHRLEPHASRLALLTTGVEAAARVFGFETMSALASLTDGASVAADVAEEIHGSGGLPPATREGDLVACWPVLRRPDGSDARPLPPSRQSWRDEARTFRHIAVIRDSTVIAQFATAAPPPPNGGTPSCNV